ncbi:MAG: hypothetical protein M3430_21910 [Acidobacteriota bacterium]|nr:hypothetical protein [Acidobacteriota bacterium]
MSNKLTSEEKHAAQDADLSRWRREAREWSGREGGSGRDETAARLLDEREAAQDHAEDERRRQERAEESSDEGR